MEVFESKRKISIYIINHVNKKKNEFVSLSVRPDMRFLVLRPIKLKLGRVVVNGPLGLWSNFQSDPTKGLRSCRGQIALEMPMATKLGGKNP